MVNGIGGATPTIVLRMSSEFLAQVRSAFPGSMPAADYLALLRSTIEPLGFVPSTTLPMVSICRDELTTNFFARIQEQWGPAFTLAGLGGVPALGRTGWGAAFSHIPNTGGRGNILVLGFPHIGIEDDGSIGVTLRDGQTEPTATCGALASIYHRAKSGSLPREVDPDDFEATKLALRLVDPTNPPASLVDLTVAALDALEIDLWAAIDEQRIWEHHDVTVWCGVQINGHGGKDWIWPRDAWLTGRDGQRRQIVEFG